MIIAQAARARSCDTEALTSLVQSSEFSNSHFSSTCTNQKPSPCNTDAIQCQVSEALRIPAAFHEWKLMAMQPCILLGQKLLSRACWEMPAVKCVLLFPCSNHILRSKTYRGDSI
eukprot:scaffold195100_cov15-Tisochrysis_lutea.AAC.1